MTPISLIIGPNTSGHNRACNTQQTAENFLLHFPIRTGREKFSFRVTKPGHVCGVPTHGESPLAGGEKEASTGVCWRLPAVCQGPRSPSPFYYENFLS